MQDSRPLGVVYKRWGRSVCPSEATLVYSGVMASGWYANAGTGSNYLCLPLNPSYINHGSISLKGHSIYSTEYRTSSSSDTSMSSVHKQDAPCAVCQSSRSNLLMIPADTSCRSGWFPEYVGYLMSTRYDHASNKNYVCVDGHPEAMFGSERGSEDSSLLYFTIAGCNGYLGCPPFINGAALSCVVCTN